MPLAQSTTTTQYVSVTLGMREILSMLATGKQQDLPFQQSLLIPVTLHRVEAMLFVNQETGQEHADVCLNTSETHMWLVGQSVWFTRTAPPTKHARGTSASTHALELVE